MNVKEEHMIFLFNPHSNMYVCMYVCISNSDFKSDTKTYRTGNYIKEVGKIRALDPRSGATSKKTGTLLPWFLHYLFLSVTHVIIYLFAIPRKTTVVL